MKEPVLYYLKTEYVSKLQKNGLKSWNFYKNGMLLLYGSSDLSPFFCLLSNMRYNKTVFVDLLGIDWKIITDYCIANKIRYKTITNKGELFILLIQKFMVRFIDNSSGFRL